MVNCKEKEAFVSLDKLSDPKVFERLTENVGVWLQTGVSEDFKLLGSKEQIKIVKEAIIASKNFQDELCNPSATLLTVENKLLAKHQTARSFSKTFNVSWPF